MKERRFGTVTNNPLPAPPCHPSSTQASNVNTVRSPATGYGAPLPDTAPSHSPTPAQAWSLAQASLSPRLPSFRRPPTAQTVTPAVRTPVAASQGAYTSAMQRPNDDFNHAGRLASHAGNAVATTATAAHTNPRPTVTPCGHGHGPQLADRPHRAQRSYRCFQSGEA